MAERYFRAGFFPTGHRDQDMLWLDFRADDADDASAKAHAWACRYEGYDLLVVRELDRKAGKKRPREEPAEYCCDYDLGDAKRRRFSLESFSMRRL